VKSGEFYDKGSKLRTWEALQAETADPSRQRLKPPVSSAPLTFTRFEGHAPPPPKPPPRPQRDEVAAEIRALDKSTDSGEAERVGRLMAESVGDVKPLTVGMYTDACREVLKGPISAEHLAGIYRSATDRDVKHPDRSLSRAIGLTLKRVRRDAHNHDSRPAHEDARRIALRSTPTGV